MIPAFGGLPAQLPRPRFLLAIKPVIASNPPAGTAPNRFHRHRLSSPWACSQSLRSSICFDAKLVGLVALVPGRRSVLAPAAVSLRRAGVWCHARLPPACVGPGVRALAASESSIASRVAAIRECGLSFNAIARNSRVDDHTAAKFSVVVSAALTAGWRAAEAVGRKALRSAHDPRCAGAAVGQRLGVAVVVSEDQDSPGLAVAHVENRSSATSVQPPSSWVRLSSRMTPHAFIEKWRASQLKERSASQEQFIDLCHLLDEPTPAEADPSGEIYCFERGARKDTGGDGWADVWKRHHFVWEYKGKRADLDAAFRQLRQYSLALENPPLLIVSDMVRFRIRTNWTNSVSRTHEFDLEDLAEASTRDRLKRAFSDPDRLRPGETRQALTERVAASFASVAQALRARGHDPQAVAHFGHCLVFCMFGDAVGLLACRMFNRMLRLALRVTRSEAVHGVRRRTLPDDRPGRPGRLRTAGLVQRRAVRRWRATPRWARVLFLDQALPFSALRWSHLQNSWGRGSAQSSDSRGEHPNCSGF